MLLHNLIGLIFVPYKEFVPKISTEKFSSKHSEQKVPNELKWFILKCSLIFKRKALYNLNSVFRSTYYLDIKYSICELSLYLEIEYLICRSNWYFRWNIQLHIELIIRSADGIFDLETEYWIC